MNSQEIIFGLHMVQEAEMTQYCFGECGKILLGILDCGEYGILTPCRQQDCPYEEGRLELGKIPEGEVWVRKLRPLEVVSNDNQRIIHK